MFEDFSLVYEAQEKHQQLPKNKAIQQNTAKLKTKHQQHLSTFAQEKKAAQRDHPEARVHHTELRGEPTVGEVVLALAAESPRPKGRTRASEPDARFRRAHVSEDIKIYLKGFLLGGKKSISDQQEAFS